LEWASQRSRWHTCRSNRLLGTAIRPLAPAQWEYFRKTTVTGLSGLCHHANLLMFLVSQFQQCKGQTYHNTHPLRGIWVYSTWLMD
jgi:hypothetical protein